MSATFIAYETKMCSSNKLPLKLEKQKQNRIQKSKLNKEREREYMFVCASFDDSHSYDVKLRILPHLDKRKCTHKK